MAYRKLESSGVSGGYQAKVGMGCAIHAIRQGSLGQTFPRHEFTKLR
jgi:hypothetical protein